MDDSRDKLPAKWKNYDFTNAIGLLLLMKEIQEQGKIKSVSPSLLRWFDKQKIEESTEDAMSQS